MDYGKIKLTLEYRTKQIDIRVSKALTWLRLEELLKDTKVREQLNLPRNSSFCFKVRNKQIHIEPMDILAAYPVSDGDYIEIEEVS